MAIYIYQSLIEAIERRSRARQTVIIGIDGNSGGGKSTFARMLAAHRRDATIIHMDDLYLPSSQRISGAAANSRLISQDYNIAQLRDSVLKPLAADQPGRYQRYDWVNDGMAEWHTVPVGGWVIIEGVSALLPEFVPFYDERIWVVCPYELRLRRGVERDGEAMRSFWVNHWMPAEERYVAVLHPESAADRVVDGSGVILHDVAREFVQVSP